MDNKLGLHAQENILVRVLDMYLCSNYRRSLGIGSGHFIDFGNLAFIFFSCNGNIHLLADFDFGQVIFGDFDAHLYLLVAFYGKKLGSFSYGSPFQKAAALGCILGCGYGGNLGYDAGEFRNNTRLSLLQLCRRFTCGNLCALYGICLLLLGIRIGNSRFGGGFLSFPLADLFFHILQLLLLRVNNTLGLPQVLGHAQIAELVACFPNAVIQVLDDFLNSFSGI